MRREKKKKTMVKREIGSKGILEIGREVEARLEKEIKELESKKLSAESALDRIAKEANCVKREVDKQIAQEREKLHNDIAQSKKIALETRQELERREKQIVIREKEVKNVQATHDKIEAQRKAVQTEKEQLDVLRSELSNKIRQAELREEQARLKIGE